MTEQNPAVPPQELSIEMDDATANGVYSNLALITHSETEFVLDFIFHSPQPPKARVRSRIITNPAHMKRFLLALQDNISRYEARFGPIRTSGQPPADNKVGFFH
ncbi:MAG TPA: DUF3467 domain-containing protein [Elusimicrobiota bacterium]|nr:DUF3467 domain-containing protein [Elusimicrobiota bacterium]